MKEKRVELLEQVKVLRGIREEAGLNRRQFSEYMKIPLRTLEEWEAGRRKMPDYVLRLIAYYAKMERFMKEKGIQYQEDMDGEDKGRTGTVIREQQD